MIGQTPLRDRLQQLDEAIAEVLRAADWTPDAARPGHWLDPADGASRSAEWALSLLRRDAR
jgi:hypothetical protein